VATKAKVGGAIPATEKLVRASALEVRRLGQFRGVVGQDLPLPDHARLASSLTSSGFLAAFWDAFKAKLDAIVKKAKGDLAARLAALDAGQLVDAAIKAALAGIGATTPLGMLLAAVVPLFRDVLVAQAEALIAALKAELGTA
jgi:hypothetical protein